MLYLTNKFSFNMIPDTSGLIGFNTLSEPAVIELLQQKPFQTIINYEPMVKYLSQRLDLPLKPNSTRIKLTPADHLLVATYQGPGIEKDPTGGQVLWRHIHYPG